MTLLAVVVGFTLALIAVTWGAVLHMRYLDRKLVPPPQKPEKPKAAPEPQPIAPPPPYVPTQALPLAAPDTGDLPTGGQGI